MSYYRLIITTALLLADLFGATSTGKALPLEEVRPMITIRSFVPEQGICRAERAITITAAVVNDSDFSAVLIARLQAPTGIQITKPGEDIKLSLAPGQIRHCSWTVKAQKPEEYKFRLQISSKGSIITESALDLRFFNPMPIKKLPYIPDPQPVKTSILVGAHNCPLWEANRPEMWAQILKHPERTPALGFYSQENPEVADWETKWAVEHGVSFFIYCWYRASQGEPVKMNYGSAIHDALFKSRFADRMKFTIMWENQSRGVAGVSNESDLMTNLLPFWIDNYFKRSNYLKIDNKPVLFIYRPEFLIQDLGSVENVAKAFDKMRRACVDAGFDGLYILGEYRGLDPNHLKLMKQLGLDYTFAYCWGISGSPTPEQAIETQMNYIKETHTLGIIPQVATVSQAWSGWADEGSIWQIPPDKFEGLLKQAKNFISTFPHSELGSKMLLLDNWNEWGEGHYIAPYREYGFGYLDAVRNVFSDAPKEHIDLIPDDIGLAPYDLAYKNFTQKQEQLQQMRAKKVTRDGANEPGLIGWWTFDEKNDSPIAYDYSGHKLGGDLRGAKRVKGISGSALDCDGGCVVVPSNKLLSMSDGITLECWVFTNTPDQMDKWIINRIPGGKPDTGYRFGLFGGAPSFGVPQTPWNQHLTASKPLPLGRWVHLAGTFDGQTIRIYIDGEECGSMERPGPIKPNDCDLCLGSYEPNHIAHFTGLLDEVKLYNRALSAAEIKSHAVGK